jgi:serine phosphatase RsbU (regulator of sigma subunit)
MARWWRLLDLKVTRASDWWRMPLIGLLVSAPISLTTSLFLATYGAQGPYGGFWRLVFAGLLASVPIFALSGAFFSPLEIWLNRRPQPLGARQATAFRTGTLAIAGVIGGLIAYAIVVWALPAAPPSMLLPVLLITYPLNTALVGLAYSLYDQYTHHLRVSTHLTQEMRVARRIQRGLFPRQSPTVDGFAIAARCEPARETGGDFFDFIDLKDGRLGVIVADVAGKGMPAALLMANARSTWRAEARLGFGPAETLRRANRSLYPDIDSNRFVTCVYAVLDPAARQMALASAGHPLALLRNDAKTEEIEVYGLPLGLTPDASYDEVQVALEPGETVLLYTDGITETMNASREMYGFERLAAFLQNEGNCSAENLVQLTWSDVRTYSGDVAQEDDITLVALKVCA